MTFRRPFKQKWFWPFLVTGLLALAWMATLMPAQIRGRTDPILWSAVLVLAASAVTMISRVFLSSSIVVDDLGVRWKEGGDEGDLKWTDISKLVQDGTSVGLVERASARPLKLPFVTRELYETLARRLNRLKPEEEKILFP